MSKGGGSLPKGKRLPEEVPPVPDPSTLNPLEQEAQRALRSLVDDAGGRFDRTGPIRLEYLDLFADLFGVWAHEYGTPTEYGVYFSGRPGLWRCLDELYPLQDPNRWDGLRKAVIERLEQGSWRRHSPRVSQFEIIDE